MIVGEYCDVYPPELDGVGMVVKSYAEELSAMGDDCYYIAPDSPKHTGEPAFKTLLFKGIKVPKEPYHLGFPLLDIDYRMTKRKIPFDIIHAHSPFAAGVEALRVARKMDIPIVGTFHSKYYDDLYSKTHSRIIAKTGSRIVANFYDKCDEVWTVNHATAEVLHSYGYDKEIHVMPNGTNVWYPTDADRMAAQERYGLGDGTVLLFVGQMNWKKNIRKILDAVRLYSREAPCRMLMVGQGPFEEEIRGYVRELGMDGMVTFTGHIADRSRIMQIYARADLLIFPSLYDNAPMVVREAAAAGTPAVLVRGSCAAEGIVDRDNGFLCEDTAESIAEVIARSLPVVDEVGAKARQTIPQPWKEIIRQARGRYADLIEHHRVMAGPG